MCEVGRTIVVLLLLDCPVFFLIEEASVLGVTIESWDLRQGSCSHICKIRNECETYSKSLLAPKFPDSGRLVWVCLMAPNCSHLYPLSSLCFHPSIHLPTSALPTCPRSHSFIHPPACPPAFTKQPLWAGHYARPEEAETLHTGSLVLRAPTHEWASVLA